MSDKPFCAWPWFYQKVNADGRMRPCCQWLLDDSAETVNYTHENFFHGPFMEDLRDKFSKGIVPNNCRKCVYMESLGGHSTRLMGLETAQLLGVDTAAAPVLLSQEVDLSNRCNLRCRYCSSHRSRKWNRDAHLNGYQPQVVNAKWKLTEEQAGTLRRLSLLGGEPLLHQKQIVQELNKMRERGTLGNLRLLINSNGTIPLGKEFIECITSAKRTSIDISIDAAGPLNDYIRSDSSWKKIEKNMQQLLEIAKQHRNFSIGLTCTLSVFNAGAFGDLQEWWQQYSDTLHVAIVTIPEIQNACNLPEHAKMVMVDRYEKLMFKPGISSWYLRAFRRVINHLKNPAELELEQWKLRLRQNTNLIDHSRSIRLIDYNPDLAAWIAE